MNRLSMKYIILLFVLLFTGVAVCEGQSSARTRGKSPEKSLFGKHRKSKDSKPKESRSVRKAKKKQADKEAKVKKDYNNYVADSKKRAYQIQTPEVQARMKQDQKDIKDREKNKKKKRSTTTRGAQKKYKK